MGRTTKRSGCEDRSSSHQTPGVGSQLHDAGYSCMSASAVHCCFWQLCSLRSQRNWMSYIFSACSWYQVLCMFVLFLGHRHFEIWAVSHKLSSSLSKAPRNMLLRKSIVSYGVCWISKAIAPRRQFKARPLGQKLSCVDQGKRRWWAHRLWNMLDTST